MNLQQMACEVVDGTRFVWFDLLRPINNLSVIKRWVFLGWTSTKLGFMFLLKDTMQWHPSASSQALYHWATALPDGTCQHFLKI